jgi:crotonobetainyl-CoA:carnitine CoA-transferase CaiB-like acyl-CoA transferase
MRVDLSVLECMVAVFGSDAIARQLNDGRVTAQALGREIPAVHAASDGLVAFAIVTAQQWSDFCLMIEKTEWMQDPELATSAGRRRRGDEVAAAVDDWVGRRTTLDVTEHAALLRIPAGVVANGMTVPTLECYADTFSTNPAGFVQPRFPLRFSPVPPGSDGVLGVSTPVERQENGASDRPLSGVRIADFTAFWAGPYAACLLALLGADVIHVESGKRPDGMRMRSARPPSDPTWLEWSSIFHLNNASKRSICIDMDQPEGLGLAQRLIERCNGVIENFSPRVMQRFGLDGEGVAHLNPDTVYVRMPAFGLDNPWRDRPAFQHTIEPLAGLAGISGYPDRDPQPVMICDALGGVHAAFAMLCGLRHRETTGRGVHVEVRLSEVAAAIAAEQTVVASMHGVALQRIGNHHRRGGPQGVYACRSDSGPSPYVAISVDSDAQWQRLRAVVGIERWRDESLDHTAARLLAADRLDEELAQWCGERDVTEVVQSLAVADVPVAVVSRGTELLGNPQLDARGFFTTIAHPVCGSLSYPGLPMVATLGASTPVSCRPHSPAPMLGEHDEIVETMLGVPRAEAIDLRERGVTGSRTTSNLPM